MEGDYTIYRFNFIGDGRKMKIYFTGPTKINREEIEKHFDILKRDYLTILDVSIEMGRNLEKAGFRRLADICRIDVRPERVFDIF